MKYRHGWVTQVTPKAFEMHWVYLLAAIFAEALGTASMKLSEGFTRPEWAVVMAVGYIGSLTFLTLSIEKIDLSIAYAIWAGVGTVAGAVIGVWVFQESMSLPRFVGIGLVTVGVVLLQLSAG